jgi:hypothetical protein
MESTGSVSIVKSFLRLLELVAYIAPVDVGSGLQSSGERPGGGQSGGTRSSHMSAFSVGGPSFDMLASAAGDLNIVMKRAGARPTMHGAGKLAEYARTQKTYGGMRNDRGNDFYRLGQ